MTNLVDDLEAALARLDDQQVRAVQALVVGDFDSDGPRISVRDPATRGKLFTLALDRSDAKITIKHLPETSCTVHGTWTFDK